MLQIYFHYDVNSENPEFIESEFGVKWKDWSTVGFDLTNYSEGDEIEFIFEIYDCGLSNHNGFAYIVMGEEVDSITQETCDENGQSSITAPSGYEYLWCKSSKNLDISCLKLSYTLSICKL